MLQRYAVFLYLQNLYLSTSKRCIKMGIPSLNSAIFYNVSLFTLSLSRARLTLSFVSLVLKRQADYERASYCHFERAKRVEKSKSCKSDSHPRKPPYSWTTCPQTAPQSTQNINLCNKSQSAVLSGLPHRSHSGSVHIYIS